jgi:hypothetical protein
MMLKNNSFRTALLVAAVILAGCDSVPGFNKQAVSFSADVLPILQSECQSCHAQGSEGYAASGFSVQDYASVMAGTKLGPVVKPGDSISSTLFVLISRTADPSIQMPRHDASVIAGLTNRMQQDEVDMIARWIDEGAKDN